MSSPTETVLAGLGRVKAIADGWMAQCPTHDDSTASLHVSEGDNGEVLLHCHAGCVTEQIVAALGISLADLFPPREKKPKSNRHIVARYDYRDERGVLLYQSVRFEPKDFLQCRIDANGKTVWKIGDVRRVLYRLPMLQHQSVVYVVEGEKDADALAALGLAATTNAGGAGKWVSEYSEQLRAAGVTHAVILPDNDEPGRKHAAKVAQLCAEAQLAVKVVELPGLPVKGDVSDWLAIGHTKVDLVAVVKQTARYVLTDPNAPVVSSEAVGSQVPFAATCWHLTELGAAEFFADRYGPQLRYDHRRQRWLVWSGHRWTPDANAQVQRFACDHMRQWQRDALEIPDRDRRQRIVDFAMRLERRGGVDNVLAMARALRPIAMDGLEWDTDPYLLGVRNGVVNLRTGAFRPGDPTDKITMATACTYDEHAEAPQWRTFLEAILPDADVREFLQLFVGYSLTGNTDEQVLAMLYGKGSNGKSTMLSTLVDVLGDYAATIAFSALEMKRSDIPSDIASLQNIRFVMASEVKEGQRFNEARIKSLTGGDVVAARHLYGEWFSFKPAAKFFLAVNHKPTVADDSYGFWRRIRLIPFTQSFTGSDRIPDLQQRLLGERDGILQWAITGALRWQQTRLPFVIAIDQAGQEYQDESDPLAEFVAECCEPAAREECKAGLAYSTYSKWAETRRIPRDSVLRPASFGMRFAEKFERIRRTSGVFYIGVRITSERLF